jgi:hypothetical protein
MVGPPSDDRYKLAEGKGVAPASNPPIPSPMISLEPVILRSPPQAHCELANFDDAEKSALKFPADHHRKTD